MVGYLADSFCLPLHSDIVSVDLGKIIFAIFPPFQYPRNCQLQLKISELKSSQKKMMKWTDKSLECTDITTDKIS